MDCSAKKWLLVYFIEFPRYSNYQANYKALWQKCQAWLLERKIPLNLVVFNVSKWDKPSILSNGERGPMGAQGPSGTQGSTGLVGSQGPAIGGGGGGSVYCNSYSGPNGVTTITLFGGGGGSSCGTYDHIISASSASPLPVEKTIETATWQDLLLELQKGREYKTSLFGTYYNSPAEFLILMEVDTNINLANLEEPDSLEVARSFDQETTRWQRLIKLCEICKQASFFIPRFAAANFNSYEAAEYAHKLCLRNEQPQIYQSAGVARTVVRWLNLITNNNIELPALEGTILPFGTEADYQAHLQVEAARQAQEKADWDAKHRIDGKVCIEEETCSVTGRQGTCIVFEDGDGDEYSVLLDHLIEEARKRGFVFGNQRLG